MGRKTELMRVSPAFRKLVMDIQKNLPKKGNGNSRSIIETTKFISDTYPKKKVSKLVDNGYFDDEIKPLFRF